MKMPWMGKTGLAKATALCATTLGIAFGLCGINFVAVVVFSPLAGTSRFSNYFGSTLGILGSLELMVIAVSAVGLLVIALIKIAQSVFNHFRDN